MISLARTPAEATDESHAAEAAEAPIYPYGLVISLDETTLGKLGIDGECEVDAPCTIMAKGKVIGYSTQAMSGGETERRCEIQITDMDLSGVGEADEGAASKMYGTRSAPSKSIKAKP